MTNETRSKLLGIAVLLFAIIVPLFIVFTYYVSLEETTSHMTIGIIGIFVVIGIFFGLVKLIKRRIKLKTELKLKVSPYVILLSHTLMGLIGIICFTIFLNVIKGEIVTLVTVMTIISTCEVVAFGLKFWQLRFDLKVVAEEPTEE
jgi:hypothetical protein